MRKLINPYYMVKLRKKLGIQKYYNDHIFEKKTIFIHIPKSAGMSVVKALYGLEQSNHATCDDYINENREAFANFFKFTFVRNPYSRCLSAYNYLKTGGKGPMDRIWRKKYIASFETFDKFVMYGLERAISHRAEHFIPQHEFIYDKDKKLMVDFVGRYENLQTDFKYVTDKLKIKCNLEIINKTAHSTSKQISDETKEMIHSCYSKDFKLLNYTK